MTANIPTDWLEVDRETFDWLMFNQNATRTAFAGACFYRVRLGVGSRDIAAETDSKPPRYFVNPEHFPAVKKNS